MPDMVKRLCLIMALVTVALASCAGARVETPQVAFTKITSRVERFVDVEAGVVCWLYRGGYAGGLSCLPLSETTLVR